MNRTSLAYLIVVLLSMCIISCTNSSEVKFLGKNLSTSCEDFSKHLEENGFVKDDGYYNGKYLGEDVSIKLLDEQNGHYSKMMLMAASNEYGSIKQLYKEIIRDIRKEHSGFKEEEDNSDDARSVEFYNDNGSSVKITFAGDNKVGIGMLLVMFDLGEKYK